MFVSRVQSDRININENENGKRSALHTTQGKRENRNDGVFLSSMLTSLALDATETRHNSKRTIIAQ